MCVAASRLFARPPLLLLCGLLVAICAVYLWVTPTNPPGFIRDEASVAYNAYSLSQTLRDQDGALLPLYFRSYDDYKSPLFVYLLAGVFRITGPDREVARAVAGACMAGAIVLLALLAYRRSKSLLVAGTIAALAAATPWLYEFSRPAYETMVWPLAIAAFFVALDWALRSTRHFLLRALPVALGLAAVTYSYAGGRVLGPLFAVALVVFAGRARWRWLVSTWTAYAACLVPLLVFWQRHPYALRARFDQTAIETKGKNVFEIAGTFLWNYVRDANPWQWIVSGDPRPYVHAGTWGALLIALYALALIGAVVVVREHRADRWWWFVLAALVLAPVPGALTDSRYYQLRLVALPIVLLILAIPGALALVRAARKAWLPRVVAAALVGATVYQVVSFVGDYRVAGPNRTELYEAELPRLLDFAFIFDGPVHVDHDDRYAQTHALWHAVANDVETTEVAILPDGGAPPPGGISFGRFQECDYPCRKVQTAHDYWVARAEPPG